MKLVPLVCLALLGVITPGHAADSANGISDPGERLVLVGTQLTEIVFALGAGTRVAATHGYRDHVPGVEQAESILGFGPSVGSAETLLAFRPSAIWFMDGRIDEPALAALRAIGVPLVWFPGSWELDDVPAHVAAIARALSLESEGVELTERFLAEIEAMRNLPALEPAPLSIFILAGGNRPMLTAGRDSDFQRLIDLAGGRNASTHRGFQLLSAEEMLRIGPEIVFLLDEAMPAGRPPVVSDLPGLRFTPAARGGRFREIRGYCLSGVGIYTPSCARRLRDTLKDPDGTT